MLTLLGVVSEPGRQGKPNEDAAGAVGRFAWVIDGATGLGDTPLLDGPSDAAWLTGVLDRAMKDGAGAAPSATALLRSAVAEAETRFVAERRRAPEERYEIPTAAVLIVEAVEDGLEIVELGDTAVYVAANGHLARYGGTEHGRTTERDNARRMMAGGAGRTPEVTAFLRQVRNTANMPGGYPVVAPDRRSAEQARHHRHPAPAGLALLLTDGYDAAVEDYGLFDAVGLVAAAEADIAAPLAALRAVEREDPACVRYPRFKPSDDATAALVAFGAVAADPKSAARERDGR